MEKKAGMEAGARDVRGGLLMHAGGGCMLRAYLRRCGVIGKLLLCENQQDSKAPQLAGDKVHQQIAGCGGQYLGLTFCSHFVLVLVCINYDY